MRGIFYAAIYIQWTLALWLSNGVVASCAGVLAGAYLGKALS